jgi:hypothetical protein
MRRFMIVLFVLPLLMSCSMVSNDVSFSTNGFQLSLNKSGSISKLLDLKSKKNVLAQQENAPFISMRVAGDLLTPQSVKYEKEANTLFFSFQNNIEASVLVVSKENHLTFELIALTNSEDIELVVWGPYPTIMNKIIGETVGVIQGEEFAIGIQSLNPKTLGGYPWSENDCMPQIDIFDQDDPSDMTEEGKRYVLYRVEAAKPQDYGSSLQAYCRNRNNERVIENWGHEKYTASAFDDGGMIGSKIALFGSPVESVLETISEIEVAEGLPHPFIDGEWGKTAPSASAAYLIMGFGERDIERALKVTRKAGLRYLYHPGPFENWGHFDLDPKQFPNGAKGMKRCVDKAKQYDIFLGAHTLSNFITPNDPYVTPNPDPRLAKVGTSLLTEDISKTQTEIPIESPDFFNQFKNNHLKTVAIGNELVRYGSISEDQPWQLLDCTRGAFDTKAASHKKGDSISKLADHAYRVFLTNPELSIEMAKNIAELYKTTGLRQISFDGLEGNRSTAMGNYGEILFAQAWYDNLSDDIKSHYIADASRTCHYFWHMYTRMNWGEPWYAGFRESQTEYRMKNQPYFKRNLMPAMLGWFKLSAETTIEDTEWMLARSAAFNAGYAFVVSYEDLDKNGNSDEILRLLGMWEKARMSGAFSEDQKTRMEDLNNEFRLETVGENQWQLYQIYSYKFNHEKKVRQPGEPLYSSFSINNPVEKRVLGFILTADGADISTIKFEIDNHKDIPLPVTLKKGETIKYSGGKQAIVYDRNWRTIKSIKMDPAQCSISKGDHTVTLDCDFSAADEAQAKLELRVVGDTEEVAAK